MAEALLTVPPVDACLPVALSSFTWHLLVPANATLDLRSPAPGGLRQSLPGQECGGAGALSLVEGVSDGGRPIGTFCQQGVLERMQVHGNVSVTVATRGVTRAPGPVLNVSVTDEISGSWGGLRGPLEEARVVIRVTESVPFRLLLLLLILYRISS